MICKSKIPGNAPFARLCGASMRPLDDRPDTGEASDVNAAIDRFFIIVFAAELWFNPSSFRIVTMKRYGFVHYQPGAGSCQGK
jgi:hypothetical protein